MTSYKFEQDAKKYLEISNISNPEVLALCPFHGDKNPSFRFNMNSGLWICYSCGLTGNIESFYSRLNEHYIEPTLTQDILDEKINSLQFEAAKIEKKIQYIPEASLKRFRHYHNAWYEKRRFSEDTIDEWDLGYDPLSKRLVIPARNLGGRLIGHIYRRLDDGRPKYMYPKGFPRKSEMFGSWRKLPDQPVCLVEGSLDAINVWQANIPALAIYGSYFSQEHHELLHTLGVTSLVLFYDNDIAGKKVTEQTCKIVRDIPIKKIDWNNYRKDLDPGKLPIKIIRKMYEMTL